MQPLVTICARGGSKGLPGKNIRPLLGKPLIRWTVDQAKKWGKGEICVSSDDMKILAFAEDVFAIPRTAELAKDDTPKLDVIRDCLWFMENACSMGFDPIIDLDVTNPLRRIQDIEAAYQTFVHIQTADNLFSVTKARRNPYFNQVEGKNGFARISKPKFSDITRRQDAPEVYDVNCCIYIYSRDWLLEGHKFCVTDNSMFYVMPDYSFMDTDTLLDFEITSFLMDKYCKELA